MGEAAQIPAPDTACGTRATLVRFGLFEADLRAGELRKSGLKIKLYGQPFQVLTILLEQSGKVVTREDLHDKLWAKDTFVDFEHGLNKAINRVREALGDDADNPRFIETLPRKGYRFIAPVTIISGPAATPAPAPVLVKDAPRSRSSWRRPAWLTALVLAAVALAVVTFGIRSFLVRRSFALRPVIHSIAVLPLVNLSYDDDHGFFADGMTEALITDLGKAGSLRVISHTSVSHFKNTQLLIPQIAHELQVDAVIEGTVMRSGDRVRVTANLIQASPERHIWADAYERDLHDVLALQDEIAASITREVQAKSVGLTEKRPQTVTPEAYREYLWGRRLFGGFTYESEQKAIEHLSRAISLDPNLALAYATRAEAYIPLISWGLLPPRESLAKAEADARKALSLDDTLPDAHVGMAGVHVMRTEWAEAEQEFQHALVLNPNHYMAHDWHGYLLGDIGNHEGELAEMKYALQLDPVSEYPHKSLAGTYLETGRYDEAIKEAKMALELNPAFDVARWVVARCYEEHHKYPEAIAEFQRLDDPADMAHVYGVSGSSAKARAILHKMEREAKAKYIAHQNLAIVLVALGENDAAVAELEKADLEGEPFDYMNQDSRWNPLRSDPRFQALLRRHHLHS